MQIDKKMREILDPAYLPCSGFDGACKGYCIWDPEQGHVPRGYFAAKLTSVQLIIVTAEPGDPAGDESFTLGDDYYEKSQQFFYRFFVKDELRRGGKSAPFHRNLSKILSLMYPELNEAERLERTLFTNAVLCSARVSGGKIPSEIERFCGETYLKKQILAFPDAFVLALGGKAANRLSALGINWDASGHHPSARPSSNPAKSWEEAASIFRDWSRRKKG